MIVITAWTGLSLTMLGFGALFNKGVHDKALGVVLLSAAAGCAKLTMHFA